MSSTDAALPAYDPLGPLPSALPAMWRALVRGYRAEPLLLGVSFGLVLLAALPDALLALLLKLLVDGLHEGNDRLVLLASCGLAVSTAATWFLRVISDRVQRRFRDQVTIALESHVAELQASVGTIEHHERPELLDRLAVLRNQVFVLDHMYMSLFTTCAWILRLVVTVGLLISVHPVLSLLVVAALPTVVVSGWRPGIERRAEEQGAESARRGRHLFDALTTASPAKEVRVLGIQEALLERQRRARETWYAPIASARFASAVWHALAWGVFGLAYVAAVVFTARTLGASAGSVLLVLAAGSRLSSYVAATAGEIGFLRGIWMDGSQRMAWLEDYAAAQRRDTDAPVPQRLERGLTFDRVSFRYPGTDRLVLEDVDLELPAGKVIAIVGENGAGKTTLIKLLCRMYAPSSGRVLVDDADLAKMPAERWRQQLSGAFQDFFRFEYPARRSVGVGDLPQLDDDPAVRRAVAQAGASDVVAALPQDLDSQLGPTWPGGVELSQGQWQKLAVARGFMRTAPLVLILDEPTAALDAETEHALFERYAEVARSADGRGRITLLVSHRFSTVRMADLIVVLDGSKVVEVGGHDELMVRDGQYARLYSIQAAGYR